MVRTFAKNHNQLKFLLVFFLGICTTSCFAQNINWNSTRTYPHHYQDTISFEWVRNKVIVYAEIGGRKGRFLIDTGAPTIISDSLAHQLQLKPDRYIPVKGIEGKVDTLGVCHIAAIKLGKTEYRNVPAIIVTRQILSQCFHLDGIIGSNVLYRSAIQFDLTNFRVIISNQSKNLGVSSKDEIPMKLSHQDEPILTITLGQSHREDLLFDSGDDELYDICMGHFKLFKNSGTFSVVDSGYGSNVLGLNGWEKNNTRYRIILHHFRLDASSELQNVVGHSTLDDNSRLGAALLKYGLVTIDFKHKRFYFTPNEAAQDAYEKDWNLNPVVRDGQLRVGTVWGDLTDEVKPGEIILSINGRQLNDIDLCDFLFRSPLKEPGISKATLEIAGEDGMIRKVEILKN